MKFVLALLAVFSLFFFTAPAEASPSKCVKTIYLSSSGVATNKGLSAKSPKPFADGDLFSVPAGTVVQSVTVVVDTAITGTSALNVGDDDDADFHCPTASVTVGTVGAYCGTETVKNYPASGKELKLDVTGTNTAGAARVIVEGFCGQ